MDRKVLFAFALFSIVILFGCVSTSNSNSSTQVNNTTIKTNTSTPATNYSFVPAPDSSNLTSTPIFYDSDGWHIRGYLYPSISSTPKKLILLLPSFGHTIEDYPLTLIARLHQEISDAIIMPIDMRGSGESINLGTYESFSQSDYSPMNRDISSAKAYFAQNYSSINQYYLVGSENGASVAINYAATDLAVTKVVLLSPLMDQNTVSIRTALSSYHGSLFIASSNQSINSLSTLSSSSSKLVKKYSNGVGTELFGNEQPGEENLEIAITNFLK